MHWELPPEMEKPGPVQYRFLTFQEPRMNRILSRLSPEEAALALVTEGQLANETSVINPSPAVPRTALSSQSKKRNTEQTCEAVSCMNKFTGELGILRYRNWHCSACVLDHYYPFFSEQLSKNNWSFMLTLTTRFRFAPPVTQIERAREARK